MSGRDSIPKPRPGVMRISPYVPGRSTATGGSKIYKLSSNETPFGPSQGALAAFHGAAERLDHYPDGGATALRQAIAKTHGLDPDRIVCGAGSDEILNFLAHAYIGPGDEGIHTRHGFLVYKIAITAAGGTPIEAGESNLTADVDAILALVNERTRLVFLANPNNPTGTYLPFAEIRRLHAGLPSYVLLVLDAAYAEYVRREDYASGLELASTAPNVVMTRTFSKIYGLASLRLGWCYGPWHVIDALNRIRGPFNVSGPGIEAGVAALADQAHIQKAVEHNLAWLPRLGEAIGGLGLDVVPSVANFVLIRFPENLGKPATAADAFLLSRGIILRNVASYGLPEALRMTVGSQEANLAAIEGLTDFLSSKGGA